MVANPPPGMQSSLLRDGSPVTRNALLPSAIAGTVAMRSAPVHASHGGVGVSFAPSFLSMRRSCIRIEYLFGSNALPGLPQ